MKRSAVFLDRDGTIIEDTGYVDDPAKVRLLPGAADAIRKFNEAGLLVVIASNQSGVARGLFDEATMDSVHKQTETLLADQGASLDGAYYCPFLDGAEATVPQFRRDSELRKPKPGLLLQAANEMDIILSRSWMIGDSLRDVEAGRRAGCKTVLIDPDGKHKGKSTTRTTTTVESLAQAAEEVLNGGSTSKTLVAAGATQSSSKLTRSGDRPSEKPRSSASAVLEARESSKSDSAKDNAHSAKTRSQSNATDGEDESTDGKRIVSLKIPSASDAKDKDALRIAKPNEVLVEIRDGLSHDLSRIEKQLDRMTRQGRQDDFSLLRLFGTLAQMTAIAVAIWGAVSLAGEQHAAATSRLLLACFLELCAVCAFTIDRIR